MIQQIFAIFAHMTPDKRLNQMEPLVADVLQKVDRLIEGQGQLVEFVVGIKAELDQVKVTGERTAAELTQVKVTGERTAAELTQVKVTGERTAAELTQVKVTGEQTIAGLNQVKATGEITANGLAKLTLVTAGLRDEMRERFDRNEQTQQEILTLLRERLK